MVSEMGGPTARSSAPSREVSTDHQLQSKAYLSPSDTSIDESVKSGKADKDVSVSNNQYQPSFYKRDMINHVPFFLVS